MSEETVRIIRMVEYVGPKEAVEQQVEHSIHGIRRLPGGIRISAVTLGMFPETLTESDINKIFPLSSDTPYPGEPVGND